MPFVAAWKLLNALETLLYPYKNYVNNFEHAVVSDISVRSDFLKDTKEEFAVTSDWAL
jgi:hypothetical protein